MAFWEDFKYTVTNTVNKAAKKTEDIADLTKKKISLKAEEDRLDSLYSQVGKLRFAEVRRGEDKSEAIENLFSEIEDSIKKVSSLRADIAKARKVKMCKNCGAELEENDIFCSKCGDNQNK